jgi:hypothetical protein
MIEPAIAVDDCPRRVAFSCDVERVMQPAARHAGAVADRGDGETTTTIARTTGARYAPVLDQVSVDRAAGHPDVRLRPKDWRRVAVLPTVQQAVDIAP